MGDPDPCPPSGSAHDNFSSSKLVFNLTDLDSVYSFHGTLPAVVREDTLSHLSIHRFNQSQGKITSYITVA